MLKFGLLGALLLGGCESFLPLKIGFVNDGDTVVELLTEDGILVVKPKTYAVVNAWKDMRICLNGALRVYSLDVSENSSYRGYIRNSKIFVRLNEEGRLWYSHEGVKSQADEVELRSGLKNDQSICATRDMRGR